MSRIGADVPVWEPYDLVVCGGGPAGIPAALAARRQGLRVLLVEGQGQLGGTTTSAGVSHLLGGFGRWAQGGGPDSVRRQGLTELVGNVRVTP